MDFNQRPFTVIWETTRACDLACLHCRAEATHDGFRGVPGSFDRTMQILDWCDEFGVIPIAFISRRSGRTGVL